MSLRFALAARSRLNRLRDISFVGSSSTVLLTGLSISIPVPTGAVAGDLLIVGTLNRSSAGGTAPSGWTLVSSSAGIPISGSSNTQYGSIYTRTYQTGDPTSFTFTQTINDRLQGVMLAFRAAAGITINTQATTISTNNTGNTTAIASVTPTRPGFVVAVSTSTLASTPDTTATSWSVSSGWTQEGTASEGALRLGVACQPSVVGSAATGTFTANFTVGGVGSFTNNTIALESP
jgi:hypothetical protein